MRWLLSLTWTLTELHDLTGACYRKLLAVQVWVENIIISELHDYGNAVSVFFLSALPVKRLRITRPLKSYCFIDHPKQKILAIQTTMSIQDKNICQWSKRQYVCLKNVWIRAAVKRNSYILGVIGLAVLTGNFYVDSAHPGVERKPNLTDQTWLLDKSQGLVAVCTSGVDLSRKHLRSTDGWVRPKPDTPVACCFLE